MNQNNQEITNFLTYYFALPTAPEYAVMLKGKWGVGKTWFVEEVLERYREYGGRALYVSLYGISSQEQIEQEFFRQLHPVLGSKGGALVGKLLKGLVKGALKIDIDGDKKEDGTLTVGVPDIDLPEYLTNTKNFVLVFDDLERCSIPISELLGYINYFVEHDGYKVIIVANEDEILDKEKKDEPKAEYRRIKEKLIGKTFEVQPDIEEAIALFLDEVPSDAQRRILAENQKRIQEMYTASGYKNLRNLRQAILDFARMLDVLKPKLLESHEMLTHLLSMFLLYTFEVKSGALIPKDIAGMRSAYFKAAVLKSKAETTETIYKILLRKYVGTDLVDTLLSEKLWAEIFETGIFNAEEINKALSNSRYFVSKEHADWVRLWNSYSLKDEELEALLVVVMDRFKNNKYINLGELRHIVGSLLKLSELKVLPEPKESILAIAYRNLNEMKASGDLQRAFEGDLDFLRDTGFGGLAFESRETNEFREFSERLEILGQEAIEAGYPEKSKQLLKLMANDTREFVRSIILVNDHEGPRYYDTPILMFMKPAEFVEELKLLSGDQLRSITSAIEQRYSLVHSREKLKPELDWLSTVAEMLRDVQTQRAGKMSGVHFQYLVMEFEAAIAALT